MADRGEQISLGFQFAASFCWAIGAGLAGPEGAADFLQFFAAVAWCLANFASLWSMATAGARAETAPRGAATAKTVELQGV